MNVVEICAYVWKWKNETCRNYSHATILKEEQGEKRQKNSLKKGEMAEIKIWLPVKFKKLTLQIKIKHVKSKSTYKKFLKIYKILKLHIFNWYYEFLM
jgi:hypothetical protein